MYYISDLELKTDYRKYSYLPNTIVNWNKLPVGMAAATALESFQPLLHVYIYTYIENLIDLLPKHLN